MLCKLVWACLFLVVSLNAQMTISSQLGAQESPVKAPASSTPPEKRCVVQGKVTNSLTGEPLKKVSVRLLKIGQAYSGGSFSMAQSQQEGYSENSAADGSFRIEGVEPGEYSLAGERAGYLRASYGAKGSFEQGKTITLSPGQQLTDIALAMVPQSVISGRVVDSDGDPVGDTNVMAVRQTWMQGRARYFPVSNSQADEEGHFRLANLEPGKYYVVAQKGFKGGMDAPTSPDKPDIRAVSTFYPDATKREAASAVSVKPGETVPDIEIHMQFVAAHHVRGRLVGLNTGSVENMHLQAMPDEADSFSFGFAFDPRNMLKADKTFDISGMTPGRYWLTAMQFNVSIRPLAEALVEVGDTDVNGIELTPVQTGTLHGQITLQGTPPAGSAAGSVKQVAVTMLPVDMRRILFGAQSETADNGAVTIQNVSPGKYDVVVHSLPKGTYLQSVLYGSQDVLHKSLDLSGGVGGDLQIVLRYGVAELDGTVTSPDDADQTSKKKVSATVYLIPEAATADGQFYSSALDQNAAFSVKDAPPGVYHAVAVDGVSQMSMQNPEISKELAAHGVEVELKENDKKQLQLPALTGSDVQQIFAKLGLEAE